MNNIFRKFQVFEACARNWRQRVDILLIIHILTCCALVTKSCPTLCDPIDWTIARQVPLSMGFSRQEYWSGLPCFPPGDLFNPGLPHRRWILHHLSHKGNPRRLEWVAYPFSRWSSWLRNWTVVSCIAGRFLTSWATREAASLASRTRVHILGLTNHTDTRFKSKLSRQS